MPPRAIACSGLRGLVAMAVDPGFVPLGWGSIRVSSALLGICGAILFPASLAVGPGFVPPGWGSVRGSSAWVGVCGAVLSSPPRWGSVRGLSALGGGRSGVRPPWWEQGGVRGGSRGRWFSFGLTALSGYGHGCNRVQCCPDGRQSGRWRSGRGGGRAGRVGDQPLGAEVHCQRRGLQRLQAGDIADRRLGSVV